MVSKYEQYSSISCRRKTTSELSRENITWGGAGGVNALQTSSIGENSTGTGISDSCGARSGGEVDIRTYERK